MGEDLLQKVDAFTHELSCALADDNIIELQAISLSCEQFLRSNLPRSSTSRVDPAILLEHLQGLLAQYQRAIQQVNNAKMQAASELQNLSRKHHNTNKYLDVARNISS